MQYGSGLGVIIGFVRLRGHRIFEEIPPFSNEQCLVQIIPMIRIQSGRLERRVIIIATMEIINYAGAMLVAAQQGLQSIFPRFESEKTNLLAMPVAVEYGLQHS